MKLFKCLLAALAVYLICWVLLANSFYILTSIPYGDSWIDWHVVLGQASIGWIPAVWVYSIADVVLLLDRYDTVDKPFIAEVPINRFKTDDGNSKAA